LAKVSKYVLKVKKVILNRSFLFLAAATVKFNGDNALSLKYATGITNEADDIVIRFRTIEQVGNFLK